MPGCRTCSSASIVSFAFMSVSRVTIVAINGPGQTSELRSRRGHDRREAFASRPPAAIHQGFLETGFRARKRSTKTKTRRLPRSIDPVAYVAFELSHRCGGSAGFRPASQFSDSDYSSSAPRLLAIQHRRVRDNRASDPQFPDHSHELQLLDQCGSLGIPDLAG